MDFKVNAVHFSADQKLIDFVEEKVKKLEVFNNNIIIVLQFLTNDGFNYAIHINQNQKFKQYWKYGILQV